jgi:hypothetical protein
VLIEPGATRTPIYQREREELAARETELHAVAYARWCVLTRALEPLMSRPDRVATTIVRAVDVQRPRRRYRVGRGAHTGDRLLDALPTAARERILGAPLGL